MYHTRSSGVLKNMMICESSKRIETIKRFYTTLNMTQKIKIIESSCTYFYRYVA